MSNWYGAYQLFRREVTRFRKIIVDTTISPVVSNLLYLIIFSMAVQGREVFGVPYIQFLAPGLITMTLINSSFSNPSFALVISKFSGTISDLLIAPFTGAQIVSAYVGAAMVRALVTALATLIVILFFTHITVAHPFLAIISALMTSLFFGTLGMIFGYYAKQFENLTMITTFVMTPMSFLGGVFYPINNLAQPWSTISLFNPMLYFIDFFRYAILNIHYVNPSISFSVALISNLVLFPFAIFLFTKGKRLTSI